MCIRTSLNIISAHVLQLLQRRQRQLSDDSLKHSDIETIQLACIFYAIGLDCHLQRLVAGLTDVKLVVAMILEVAARVNS
jgi:hypothetical protein